MAMTMTMGADRHGLMCMIVMSVLMRMCMFVIQKRVNMHMFMRFGQMQKDTTQHQQSANCHQTTRKTIAQDKGQQGTNKRRKGKH